MVKFCIAIDFDGTLVNYAWPNVGDLYEGSIEFLRWADNQGYEKILWTCREGAALNAALHKLEENGIGVGFWDGVNTNTKSQMETYGNDPRKVGCHVVLDDLAVGFPRREDGTPDWNEIKGSVLNRYEAWIERHK